MKLTMKKTLAFLLTLVMLVNIFPLSAFAEPDEGIADKFNLQKGAGDGLVVNVLIQEEAVSSFANYYIQVKQNGVQQVVDGNPQSLETESDKLPLTTPSMTFQTFHFWGNRTTSFDPTASTIVLLANNQWLNEASTVSPGSQTTIMNYPVSLSVSGSVATLMIGAVSTAHHTAHITLPAGADTDNLYVVFKQTADGGQNWRFSVVPVNGSGDYDSGTFHSYETPSSHNYDESLDSETVVLLIKTNNPLDINDINNNNLQVILNESFGEIGGGKAYRDGAAYWEDESRTISIRHDSSVAHRTNITVSDPTYTARVDFYNGIGEAQSPAFTGTYTFTATTGNNQVFTGILNSDGTISFKDASDNPVTRIPAIESWSMSPGSFEDDYTLDSLEPETASGNVYVFKARQPKQYSVELTFYDAGETTPNTLPALGSHTLTATDEDNNTYTAAVEAGELTWTRDGQPVAKLPRFTSFLLDGETMTVDVTMLDVYRLVEEPASMDPNDGVYRFTFREPVYCTASISFGDDSPSLGTGLNYYILVRKNGTTLGCAQIEGNSENITFRDSTGEVLTLESDMSFIVVKSESALQNVDLFGNADALTQVQNGGIIGQYYALTIPSSPDGNVFSFTAAKVENRFTMRYRKDTEIIPTVTPDGYYYLLATLVNEGIELYAPVPADDGTVITFKDRYNNEAVMLPRVSFALMKTDSEASSIDDVKAGTPAEKLVSSEGKKYSVEYYIAPGTRSVTDHDIVATENNVDNALVITFKNHDGSADTSPAVSANSLYAVILGNYGNEVLYYAPINPTGSQVVIKNLIDGNGNEVPFENISGGVYQPQEGRYNPPNTVSIFSYPGGVSSLQDIRNHWNDSQASKLPNGSNTTGELGLYDYVFPTSTQASFYQGKDPAGTYEITATRKDAYMINIDTYDIDGEQLEAPNPPLGGGYYIRARIWKVPEDDPNGKEVVGWTLIPIDWTGAHTSLPVLNYVDLNSDPLSNNSTKYAFDPELHQVEVDTKGAGAYPARIIKLNSTDNLTWAKATDPSVYNDNPPYRLSYMKGVNGDGEYTIRLKKSNDLNYFVRLKVDEEGITPADIGDDHIYVRVKIGHQTGTSDTYGLVKISAASAITTEEGYTLIDVPISDAQHKVGGELFTGNEESVTVQIVYVPDGVTDPTDRSIKAVSEEEYVNRYQVEHYPTTGKTPDRVVVDLDAGKPDNEKTHQSNVYDVVKLHKNNDRMEDYSLETLLTKYNAITICPHDEAKRHTTQKDGQTVTWYDGDFVFNQHTVGALLVRGDLIAKATNNFGGGDLADVASAVGGRVIDGYANWLGGGQGANGKDNEFYIGSSNTVVNSEAIINKSNSNNANLEYANYNTFGNTVVNDEYVDWAQLQRSIVNQSGAMMAASIREIEIKASDLDAAGNITIDVAAGELVTVKFAEGFPPDKKNTVKPTIHLTGLGDIPFEELPGTVISFSNPEFKYIPVLTLEGRNLPGSTDNGDGISVVYNFPNATKIEQFSGAPEYGHVIAPKADAVITSGNYNGCMVVNSMYSTAEGHLSPYRGGTIVGFFAELDLGKTVNGKTPSDKQEFDFILEELSTEEIKKPEYDALKNQGKTDNEIFFERLGIVSNEGGSIVFDKVPFMHAGTYYFRVYEDHSKPRTNYTLDPVEYLLEVHVKAVPGSNKISFEIDQDQPIKYYVISETPDEPLLHVVDAGPHKKATINTNALTDAHNMTWNNDSEKMTTGITFVNEYTASGGEEIKASKQVNGAAPSGNEKFTFTLTSEDDAPRKNGDGESYTDEEMTVTNNGAEVSFPRLYYTEDDIGQTYIYKVQEQGTDGNGYTLDTTIYTIEITIDDEDEDGVLEVTKIVKKDGEDINADDIVFKNTYKATGNTQIQATKAISGAEWPDGGSIVFTLTGTGSAPMPDTDDCTKTLTAPGTVTFGTIQLSEADAGKTYTYTISETTAFGGAWTKTGDITATVVVSDDGEGHVSATVTYNPEDKTITNSYSATGSTQIQATKAIEGAEWPDGGSIVFTLTGTGSAPMPAEADRTKTLTAPGTVTFGTIQLSEADAGKTYTYTISETTAFGGAWTKTGDITATVVVSDDGEGHVSATVTYTPEDKTITNSYSATGNTQIQATKAIEGAEWPDGGSIVFTLTGTGSAPMPAEADRTKTLTAPGTVTFGTIQLSEADAGKTYTYTISETTAFGGAWTKTGDITATVVVSDDGEGHVSATVTYTPEDKTITNSYSATGSTQIQATKAIEGAEWPDGGSIVFTLTGTGSAPMPAEADRTKTLTAPGTVTFGTIQLSEADAGKTYTYTISETTAFGGAWTKTGDITATVVVSDDGEGHMSATVTYSPEDKTITNSYSATGSTQIQATKAIEGAEWPDGGSIVFTLTGTGSAPMPDTDDCTKTLTAPGTVTFGTIQLSEADAGKTYTYTISETTGFGDGWSVSGTVTATVAVSDDGEGHVTADVTYSPEDKTITNTRQIGDLIISKNVVSEAAADADQEFTFTIKLNDATIGGTEGKKYGDITFKNGEATIKLKGGESAKAEGLPIGITYTVTEAEDSGFAQDKTKAEGTISGETSTAAFTNTRKKGILIVSKRVISDAAADADQEFEFTVTLNDTTIGGEEGKPYGDMTFKNGVATFKLKGGQSAKAEGLPTGITYTVAETSNDSFITGSTGESGTIVMGGCTAAFINTRKTGDLEVSKTVVSDAAADKNQTFKFKVTLSDTSIGGENGKTYGQMTFKNGVAEFELKGGESKKAEGLPTEITYTVVETSNDDFTTEKTGDTGTIGAETCTAAFTNTRKTGSLEVSKEVVSDAAADADQEFTFTIKLKDETIGGADGKAYGDMTFTNGEATVTLKDGEKATATGLPTGIEYTVTEAVDENFEQEKTGDEGTINTETSTAAFKNTRKTGDLEVSKKVVSEAAADKDQVFKFKVTLSDLTIGGETGKTYGDMTFKNGVAEVELKGGDSAKAEGLPTGIEYTVEETPDDNFTTEKTGDTGMIGAETCTAAFTNTRKTGSLEVSKEVVSDAAADADQEFTFTIKLKDETIGGADGKAYGDMTFTNGEATVTLKGGEKATATGLPTGIEYTVTEAVDENFEQEKTGDEGTINTDGCTAVFTNTRKTGNLEVSKTVESVLDGDKSLEFKFTVTLSDLTIGGAEGKEYGDMTFKNGIAVFTLKNGESAKAEGLPIGITYTVEEEANKNFTTESDGETGEITVAESTAAFTNTRICTFAIVKKAWLDDDDRDGIRPISLIVALLADGKETGKTVVLSADNNWMDRIDDLEKYNTDGSEIVYTWKESEAAQTAGYTLTNTENKGVLTILTNTYTPKKTEISAKKIWVDDGTHPSEVKVQLFADGIAVKGKEATLNEENGWKCKWEDLCVNRNNAGAIEKITYTVMETEIPEGYVAKVTGNASTGFVITNTKETGKLIIEKKFDIEKPDKPEEDEPTTDIEVVKIWDDSDDKDGNRPESITVHLFAGGEEIKTAKLTAANGWKITFGELPKFVNGHPIHYSVTEDPVEWYVAEIQGTTILNKYQPELTSVTVKKVWNDNNNKLKIRPKQIIMRLSNGMAVVLNEENGWTATISGLPTKVNGKPVEYTWTEVDALGYELESVTTNGSVTIFTNRPWKRPDAPGPGKKPKTPGDTIEIEEYETPLGVEIVINHVGDCFD